LAAFWVGGRRGTVFRVYATLLRPNSHSRKQRSNRRAIKRVTIKENGKETEMLRRRNILQEDESEENNAEY
jgi:hypothetical protein